MVNEESRARRNSSGAAASLEMMNTPTFRQTKHSRRERTEKPALWIALGAGLLVLLAAAVARAESGGFSATRTDRFSATLSTGSNVRVENVSGDVSASPGRSFSAVVTITVSAPTQERANEILGESRVAQSQDGDSYSLETRWPDPRHGGRRRGGSARRPSAAACDDCKITARYDVVIPPGTSVSLMTVNGEVRVKDLDGDLELQTVNGGVTVRGARKSVSAQSVNGKVDVVAEAAPASSTVELKTVNGSLTLTLPKDSKFDLSASTMTGTIASTFPLPPRPDAEGEARKTSTAPPAPPAPAVPASPAPPAPRVQTRRITVEDEDGEIQVDFDELQKELDASMKVVDEEVRRSLDSAHRDLGQVFKLGSGGRYTGAIGHGGAHVRLSTLNGPIVVLASGTAASDAKLLASPRRSFVITRPPRVKAMPRVTIHSIPSVPEVVVRESDDEVIRGDVSGDFLSTAAARSYRIGRVSGKVKILTHAGEIHVASAGSDADLKTYGGDIVIGPVRGDLKAQTLAGDVMAGAVAGSASVETSGGDIRIERVGGTAEIRTGGGDIVLAAVLGGLKAVTSGGEIRAALATRDSKGGVSIESAGGDVTLTLPSDFRGDIDLEVRGADSEGRAIHSDFPEISVAHRAGTERATGVLNGGGSRVVVRTSSGTIRLRRGAAAS
jgi:DUF4097 and DUF4098 domain-containing protein YvlB